MTGSNVGMMGDRGGTVFHWRQWSCSAGTFQQSPVVLTFAGGCIRLIETWICDVAMGSETMAAGVEVLLRKHI